MSDDGTDPANQEYTSTYPSGISSVVRWTIDGEKFRITGQDFGPGGGEYEYIATIDRRQFLTLAASLKTDVAGIEAAWAAQIARINTPGFVSWLRAHDIVFEFFTWHDFDWD